MAVNEILLKNSVSFAFKAIKHIITKKEMLLISSKESLEKSLLEHNEFILNNIKNIKFKELKGNKILSNTYIDLNIELQKRSLRNPDIEEPKNFIKDIITENIYNNHLVLLGGPGAGKTTTVKQICNLCLQGELNDKYNFPILINLREIKESESIYSKLKTIFGIEIIAKDDKKTFNLDTVDLREKYINSYLNELKAIIILDGFDEIKPNRVSDFYNEINSLFTNISSSLVILTSRSASYLYSIENSLEFEICELDKKQISLFIEKWFDSEEDSKTFENELQKSKFNDLSLRPLTLAHLCAIYEKTKKFYDKPKDIYKKLVNLLIEEWDEQRNIYRESKYSNFDNLRKFEFLSNFAYELTITYETKIYSQDMFYSVYDNIYEDFSLKISEKQKIINEIEEHNGIIIKSGYDRYEFVHKSMQEFLAAEYIVKLPNIPVKLFHDINISNELAIAVSLSSKPLDYYCKFVFEIFNKENISFLFINEFLSRLEYENPTFKENIVIPFSFIYILNILYNDDNYKNKSKIHRDELLDSYIEIINNFYINPNYKILFKKLEFHFQDEDFYHDIDDINYNGIIKDVNLDYTDEQDKELFIADSLKTEIDEVTLYSIPYTEGFILPMKFYKNFFNN
ncbi:NACHT domain-containing protein [Empedobacter falsenii]